MNFELNISKPHFSFQIQNRIVEAWIFKHLNSIQIFFLGIFKHILVLLFNNSSIKQYLGGLRTLFKNFVSDLKGLFEILKGLFAFSGLRFWCDRNAKHVVNVSDVQMHFAMLFYLIRKGEPASSFNLFMASHQEAGFGRHDGKRRVGFN
jgi:hypothetical protein